MLGRHRAVSTRGSWPIVKPVPDWGGADLTWREEVRVDACGPGREASPPRRPAVGGSVPSATVRDPAQALPDIPSGGGGCARGARHQSGTRSGSRAFAAGTGAKPANAVNPNGTFRRAPSPLSGGRQWLP